jgi:hypothetical protein
VGIVGEHVADPVDAVSPDHFELLEQPTCVADGVHVPANQLLAAAPLLGHEPRVLENCNMLLHGGEAHGVQTRETGDGMLAVHRSPDDVAPGGVGEGMEHPILPGCGRTSTYNHIVVG